MKRIFAVIIFFLLLLDLPVFTQPLVTGSEAFGDKLIIGYVGSAPAYLNPFRINNPIEKQIVQLIFGYGLIQKPDIFGVHEALVDRFKFDGGRFREGRVWQYVLKRNIIYQNGVPLRNRDVKFTYELLRKYGGYILNRKIDFSNLERIDLEGDLEIRFVLKNPDKDFDRKLTDIPILSRVYYDDNNFKGYSIFKKLKPMGYGPFWYTRHDSKAYELTVHPHYVFGRAFLNGVRFQFYENEQDLIDDFILGNVDLIELNEEVTAHRLHQILGQKIKIFPVPRPEKKVYFILFNLNRAPFNNKSVRNAIDLAINSQEIVNRLIKPYGHLAYNVIDYTNKYFFKDLFKNQYQPKLSMKILESSGWQRQPNLGIYYKNNQELSFELVYEKQSLLEESIARAVKIHLAEIGINVKPRPVEHLMKQNMLKKRLYSAVITSYTYLEEDLYSAVRNYYYRILKISASNPNYTNPNLERLFTAAETRPELRRQVLQRFQYYLRQETPCTFLFFSDQILIAVNARFQDVRRSYRTSGEYFYRLNPFKDWYVPKSLQKY